jgi:glycosyltransferase involved in cell wall biosynthesis
MKILHLLPSADPRSGGTAEAVRQQSEVFKSRGHEVEVATLDSPQHTAQWDFPAKLIGLGPGMGTYGYTGNMIKWLSDNLDRFDLMVIDAIWQYNALAGYRLIRSRKIPYVVFSHGMLDPYFKQAFPLKHLKKMLYYRLVLHRILKDADAVFFTCEEEKILARQSFTPYCVNEKVVPIGITLPVRSSMKSGDAFIARFPELEGKRVILSLGRLHPKKGVDLLIAAFAATLASDRSWQLVIAGPDHMGWQENLKAQAKKLDIANRITWTGMLDKDWKWGALSAAEVFAIPSHQENFGIVVAEALAVGLPVLMSNKVNIWREVQSSSAGFVEPDTEEGTIQLLRQWTGLPGEQVQEMRVNAKKCFERYFNLETVGDQMVEVFKELVAKRT